MSNKYENSLIDEFKEVANGKLKSVKINLQLITLKHSIELINQYIIDQNVALEFNTYKNFLYMLNENTKSKLMKGLIDTNLYGESLEQSHSDEELVSYVIKATHVTLKVIEPKGDEESKTKITGKTRPGGGFFKYLNTTHFDFSRYGIFNEINSDNYHNNCLYNAFEFADMPDNQLQTLKLFIMNRIVPKMKLKEICNTLQICIKLTSLNDKFETRTETIGDKLKICYHIGLACEHYFLILILPLIV